MSNADIRRALENRVKTLEPLLPTAWENVNFSPPDQAPYQQTNVMFAQPEDVGFRDSPYIQRGIFQITLHYPLNQGPGYAQARGELFRNHFYRGLTCPDNVVAVVIDLTPEVTGGQVEENAYVVRVKVRFYCQLGEGASNVPVDDNPQEW